MMQQEQQKREEEQKVKELAYNLALEAKRPP